MAKLILTNNRMRVSIGPIEMLRALQGSFDLPFENVRGATEDPNYIKSGLGVRSPGTGFPGLVAEGTFRKHGQKVLSLWRRGQEVVVIELANSKWDRVLIGCEDAKSLASEVNRALTTN